MSDLVFLTGPAGNTHYNVDFYVRFAPQRRHAWQAQYNRHFHTRCWEVTATITKTKPKLPAPLALEVVFLFVWGLWHRA